MIEKPNKIVAESIHKRLVMNRAYMAALTMLMGVVKYALKKKENTDEMAKTRKNNFKNEFRIITLINNYFICCLQRKLGSLKCL